MRGAEKVQLKIEVRFLDAEGRTIHVQTASGDCHPRAAYMLTFGDKGKIALVKMPTGSPGR